MPWDKRNIVILMEKAVRMRRLGPEQDSIPTEQTLIPRTPSLLSWTHDDVMWASHFGASVPLALSTLAQDTINSKERNWIPKLEAYGRHFIFNLEQYITGLYLVISKNFTKSQEFYHCLKVKVHSFFWDLRWYLWATDIRSKLHIPKLYAD